MKIYFGILSLFVYSNFAFSVDLNTDVIYGKDNRVEINDYSKKTIKELAKSVSAKISIEKLKFDSNKNIFEIINSPLKENNPEICENERFINQNQLGSCTGFLIAEDKILTAGHCAFSANDCTDYYWVFDFIEGKNEFSNDQVYKCEKIEVQKFEYSENRIQDYAIIKLDRTTKRTPLKYRKSGAAIVGTPLAIIGHPLGLPMKVANSARVKIYNDDEFKNLSQTLKLRHYYFTANLDSYAGNSGSPVFNLITKKVEGILISGAEDFKINEEKNCLESNKLSNSHRTVEEKVFRITRIDELFND